MLNVMLGAWPNFTQLPWSYREFSSKDDNFISQRFVSDAGSLQYKLFVPSEYVGQPLPLIVMLHGGGQNANDFALGTGMNELAEQHNCFVLYPEQSAQANWSMCWNWFEESHHHRGQGEPALIAGTIRDVIADYSIDETRVYIAGLSAGGAMAVILGRTYPELFAAVGCHSGLAHGSAFDRYGAMQAMKDGVELEELSYRANTVSMPLIVFHGDQDSTVHPKNGLSIVQQFTASCTDRRSHEPGGRSFLNETGMAGGRAFTRYIHSDQDGRILAEHWAIAGAGHAWSGGTTRGSYTDAGGPNASKEMLRFFLQHARTARSDLAS